MRVGHFTGHSPKRWGIERDRHRCSWPHRARRLEDARCRKDEDSTEPKIMKGYCASSTWASEAGWGTCEDGKAFFVQRHAFLPKLVRTSATAMSLHWKIHGIEVTEKGMRLTCECAHSIGMQNIVWKRIFWDLILCGVGFQEHVYLRGRGEEISCWKYRVVSVHRSNHCHQPLMCTDVYGCRARMILCNDTVQFAACNF